VVSLLPARNAAPDLPGHLESVARFADAVVALDDGSTDDTRAILEAHPLVHTVLTNPRREGYAGWDDSANRNRLLAAALDLSPSWVMSLDADELVAPDDALALRAFLLHGADPDDAYLFPVVRMIGDLDHHGGPPLWVGRLFAPRPGHVFPSERLHFVPLPTAIPRERWRRTTFRIQHRGALTPERRRARLAKYREADPDHEWQSSYAHLLDVPDHIRRWHPRGALLPALAHQPMPDPAPLGPDEPAISVVVIARNDEARILRAVTAAVHQELDEPFEVVVVTSGTDRTATVVRQAFPEVTVVALDRPALPGEARNAGRRVARGRWITFPGSHVELAPGSLAARLAAHRRGWPLVTETMRNGTTTRAGWASYFLDNAGLLPGRPSFAFESPPPRCSYHRTLLDEVGGFPEDLRAGEDSVVNEELFARGYGAWREATCVTVHHSPCATAAVLAVHHAQRGRGRGRMLADARSRGELGTRQLLRSTVRWLPGRLRWIHREVERWGGDLRAEYRRSRPLVILGAAAAWVGCWYELARLTLAPRRLLAQTRRPRRSGPSPRQRPGRRRSR
jgi:glycosyltransferase involved in cell wall biosynthesis